MSPIFSWIVQNEDVTLVSMSVLRGISPGILQIALGSVVGAVFASFAFVE